MIVRPYKESDWSTLLNWWISAEEFPPYKTMMCDSTFILEDEEKIKASVTVYLTNCKDVAFLENFIRDPEFRNKEAIGTLVKHAEDFTKAQGYKLLIALAYKDRLKNRMQTLGYQKTLDNLTSLVKEL